MSACLKSLDNQLLSPHQDVFSSPKNFLIEDGNRSTCVRKEKKRHGIVDCGLVDCPGRGGGNCNELISAQSK